MTVLNFCGWETQFNEALYVRGSGNGTIDLVSDNNYGDGSGSIVMERTTDASFSYMGFRRHGDENYGPSDNVDPKESPDNYLNVTGLYAGHAFYIDTLVDPAACRINRILTDLGYQSYLRIMKIGADLNLIFEDRNIIPRATGSTALQSGTWYYVEQYVTIGDAGAGSFEVRLNGSPEMSGNGNLSTNNITEFRVTCDGVSGNRIYHDDMYLGDSEFLGPCNIVALHPTGAGTSTQWAGDWTDLDEPFPHDESTTAITTSDNPYREDVTVESSSKITNLGTIRAVKSSVFCKKNVGQALEVLIDMRASGSTDSTPSSPLSSQDYDPIGSIDWANLRTTPPGGGSWSADALDTVEVGITHNQSQSREAEATRMSAMVLYTPTTPALGGLNYWDNSDVDGSGNNPNNWSLGHVPVTGEVAIFNNTSDSGCTFTEGIICDGIWATTGYDGNINFGDGITYYIGDSGLIFDHAGNLDWGSCTFVCSGDLDQRDVSNPTYDTSKIILAGDGKNWYCSYGEFFHMIAIASGVNIKQEGDSGYCYGGIDVSGTLDLTTAGSWCAAYYANRGINVYDGGAITGVGYIQDTSSGPVNLNPGGTISCAKLVIKDSSVNTYPSTGNYDCLIECICSQTSSKKTIFPSGTIICDSFEVSTSNTADYVVDLLTNPCNLIVEGNFTFDIDSAGDIWIGISGNNSTFEIQGDVVDEVTGGGVVNWDKGSASPEITFTNTSNQTIDFPDSATGLGPLEFDKAAGTGTLSSDLICDSLTLTTGVVDWAGYTIGTVNNFTQTEGDWVGSSLSGTTFNISVDLGGRRIIKKMDSPGTWYLNMTGSTSVTNASVKNSDASGGSEIIPTSCTNLGGNVNWAFDTPLGLISLLGTSWNTKIKSINLEVIDWNTRTESISSESLSFLGADQFVGGSPTSWRAGQAIGNELPLSFLSSAQQTKSLVVDWNTSNALAVLKPVSFLGANVNLGDLPSSWVDSQAIRSDIPVSFFLAPSTTVYNFCGWETQELKEASYNSSVFNATESISTSIKRSGTASYCIESTSDGGNVIKRFTRHGSEDLTWHNGSPNNSNSFLNKSDIWYGFGFYIDTFNGTTTRLCQGYWNSTTGRKWMVRIEKISGNMNLVFYNNAGVPQDTGTTNLASGTWYYLEGRGGTGASAPYELKLDGSEEIASGNCNQNTTNHWAFGFNAGANALAGTKIYYDDLYIKDIGFLGECSVGDLSPTGDGTYTAWTGDYTDLDEAFPHDSSTTTVNSATTNDIETVRFADSSTISDLGNIHAVKIGAFHKNLSGGNLDVQVRMRQNDINDDATTATSNSSYGTDFANLRTLPPADSVGWTASKLDTVEGGLEHVGVASREAEMTRVHCGVLYTSTGPAATAVVRIDNIYLSFYSQLRDEKSPSIDFIGDSSQDVSSPLSWDTRIKPVRTLPLSFWSAGGLVSAKTIPISWIVSQKSENVIPSSFLIDIARQSDISNSWTTRITNGETSVLDWFTGQYVGQISPVEFSTNLYTNTIIPTEWLTGSAIGQPVPLGWPGQHSFGRIIPVEFAGASSLGRVSDLPIDWMTSLADRRIIPLSFLSNLFSVSPKPTDWVNSSSLGKILPISWPSNISDSQIESVGWTINSRLGKIQPVSWINDIAKIGNKPVDWLTGSQIIDDIPVSFSNSSWGLITPNLPVDWLSSVRLGKIKQIEWLVGQLSGQSNPLAWLTRHGNIRTIPVEFGGAASFARTANLPIDWATLLRKGNILPVSWTTNLYTSSVPGLEFLGDSALGQSPAIDWISQNRQIDSIPVEFAGASTLSKTSDLPIDWLNQLAEGRTIPVDFLSNLLSFGGMRLDFISNNILTGGVPISLLGSLGLPKSIPVEFTGSALTLGRVLDLPIDWLTGLLSGKDLSINFLSNMFSFGSLNTGFISNNRLITGIPVSLLNLLGEIKGIPVEFGSSTILTGRQSDLPIDWLTGKILSKSLPVDFGSGFTLLKTLPIEFLTGRTLQSVLPFSFLIDTAKIESIPVEFLSGGQVFVAGQSNLPIDFLTGLTVRPVLPTEWLISQSKTIVIPESWLSELFSQNGVNILLNTNLLAEGIIPVEFYFTQPVPVDGTWILNSRDIVWILERQDEV
jgi:hypothetical protein